MRITVTHEALRVHSSVELHAWGRAGEVWDVEPVASDGRGHSTFVLEGDVDDPRTLSFKYRYADGATSVWEPDDYVRTVPSRAGVQSLWTFDLTPRVLSTDPAVAPEPAPVTMTFHLLTRARLAGGRLYAWDGADPGQHATFAETSRRAADQVSEFQFEPLPWMTRGFLFKFVGPDTAGGAYWEPERSNRVWRPSDGFGPWLKSGQVDLRPAAFGPVDVLVDIVSPLATPASALWVDDDIEDFVDAAAIDADGPFDADLRLTTYRARIYPDAMYAFRSADSSYSVPLRVAYDDAAQPPRLYGVAGSGGLARAPIARDAQVELVVHANPRTAFAGDLAVGLYLGPAPRTLARPASPPYARVPAIRDAAAGVWRARLRALSGAVVQALDVVDPAGAVESRPDGPVQLLRTFTAPPTPEGGAPTTLHTADGVPGLASAAPVFAEVAPADRRRLLGVAFGAAVVEKGVFDEWEMPHGAIVAPDGVWFVVKAPHAVTAELLILTEGGGPGTAVTTPMSLTPDLRYWWCRVPLGDAPHGTPYRFRFNGPDGIEALDPAGRWARDPGYLAVRDADRATAGASGPATRVVDPQRLRAGLAEAPWTSPRWDWLLVYELHPLRLTRRNVDDAGAPLCAFDQVATELAPGRYLRNLPVTVLELMPIHEFPQEQGWGYNPSLYFAIDSYYGGPEALARCVRAAHDAGKGVMLDLVYNHMDESPLQIIAADVYADGATVWGDMPNYDHPAVVEIFRQATLHMWQTFQIDGFRFDCTEAIVNGQWPNPYIIAQNPDGSWAVGSGGGWAFLGALRSALRSAADAVGQSWPYLVGENDPNNWGMSGPGGVLDGQWAFSELYPLGDAAKDGSVDDASSVAGSMQYPQNQRLPFYEAVRYGESHDSASAQDGKLRVAARPPFGQGWRMSKAVATAALLGNGVPMLFMGEEAGEDTPFYFDISNLGDPQRYLRLDAYENPGDGHNKILAWCRDLMGLRNDGAKGLQGDDDQGTWGANRTLAFSRRGGSLFTVVTFGTPFTRQDSGWLGLPAGSAYKEIFNSSWPAYQTEEEPNATNGSYDASIRSGDVLNLPFVGAVVLEKRA